MKDMPEDLAIPKKAARAMCFNLVDAGLGFERLHQLSNQGLSNHLETVLKQTFLAKISGFPAEEVDQVYF